MDLRTKRKNILDLEHQRLLNYFNICAITCLTIIFTVTWALIIGQSSLAVSVTSALITVLAFGFLLLLINSKLRKAIQKIRKL